MALRHPWYSQPLKRKHPDDFVPEGCGGCGIGAGGGGGFGVVGTNAYDVGQPSPPNQGSPNSNGRAPKRLRNFESRNLERGFAELSIQPAHSVPSPPHFQQQPGLQVGADGVWNDVVGDVEQGSSVVWSDGSTLPLLRSSSVHEPPSPEVNDVQMSTPAWYEPEKDRIIITSLDDDEYDGDDEGQQEQRTETTQESQFTISPAFLNAINKKLVRAEDSPSHPSSASSKGDPGDDHEERMLDSSVPKPPPPSPSMSSPFHVQDPGIPSFVLSGDDMEMEML